MIENNSYPSLLNFEVNKIPCSLLNNLHFLCRVSPNVFRALLITWRRTGSPTAGRWSRATFSISTSLSITRWKTKENNNLQTKMSKKYHPLGAHLTKNLRRVALFGGTLTAYNFGQNGQSCNFFGPIIKPAKSRFWEKKKNLGFRPFLFALRAKT